MIGNRHPGYAFVSNETYHILLSSILRMMTQITIYVYSIFLWRMPVVAHNEIANHKCYPTPAGD